MILPVPEFWPIFKSTNGALSCCESIAILNLAAQAPDGKFLELGVAEGKSAMSAALVMNNNIFILVDPVLADENLQIAINDKIFRTAQRNIRTEFAVGYSLDFITKYDNYAYVFVDSGSHQDGLPMKEAVMLEDRLLPGGLIVWHDFKSQFKEVEEAYNYLLSTGKYEEVAIDWLSIIDFVRETGLEKDNTSWHHRELEFPCFVGALKRK